MIDLIPITVQIQHHVGQIVLRGKTVDPGLEQVNPNSRRLTGFIKLVSKRIIRIETGNG